MEQWKAIPGFEGIYDASTYGRIRSVDGKTTVSKRCGIVHWKQRILKQHYAKRRNGKPLDARVTLWKDKKPHYFLVARLIAMTWCDGFSEGLTVNHIDGNPMNNRAENLEWVSLSENIQHGFENGLFPQKKVLLINTADGSAELFRSMACASRFLGKDDKYLSQYFNRGYRTRPGGYLPVLMPQNGE